MLSPRNISQKNVKTEIEELMSVKVYTFVGDYAVVKPTFN